MSYDTPAPAPTPSPTPATSSAPAACAVPSARPRVIKLAQPTAAVDYMTKYEKYGLVDITVYLDADGVVQKAEITHSSGDAFLDGETFDAAKATQYAAEIRDCKPVPGSYVYRTRFRDPREPSSLPPSPSPAPTPSPGSPEPTAAASPPPAPTTTP